MTTRGTAAPYFKSLNRPILIFGVDRSLFFISAGLCLPIAFSGHLAPMMDVITGLIFFSSYLAALWITRADPQMLALYRRYIQYHDQYSAQPVIYGPALIPKSSVPAHCSKGSAA